MDQARHLVFISHAAEDKAVADAMCAALERNGIRCWMAPRDIMPSDDWAEAILKAITSSKLMVLIFSHNTTQSPHVRREIERAVHHGVPIAPLRVEDVLPDGALEYFLSAQHWADLFPGPIQEHVRDVLGRVCELLGVKPGAPGAATVSPEVEPAKTQGSPAQAQAPSEARVQSANAARSKWAGTAVIVLMLIVASLLGYDFVSRNHSNHPTTAVASDEKTTMPLPAAPQEISNSIGMKLVLIPAGSFSMGSDDDAVQRPVHRVTISKPFFMATTATTQAQWAAIMGTTVQQQRDEANPIMPIVGEGGNYPMYYVSWHDAATFCQKLRAKENRQYRLPTEAEWEYACRAGSTRMYSFGDNATELRNYAWFADNSGDSAFDSAIIWATDPDHYSQKVLENGCQTHPVGTKKPNAWGLYDMHGNVCQWCADWYGEYPEGDATDPTGPANGTAHILRGGTWADRPAICTASYRGSFAPDIHFSGVGFRVVCAPAGSSE